MVSAVQIPEIKIHVHVLSLIKHTEPHAHPKYKHIHMYTIASFPGTPDFSMSACNIEKLGMPGDEAIYMYVHYTCMQQRMFHCSSHMTILWSSCWFKPTHVACTSNNNIIVIHSYTYIHLFKAGIIPKDIQAYALYSQKFSPAENFHLCILPLDLMSNFFFTLCSLSCVNEVISTTWTEIYSAKISVFQGYIVGG